MQITKKQLDLKQFQNSCEWYQGENYKKIDKDGYKRYTEDRFFSEQDLLGKCANNFKFNDPEFEDQWKSSNPGKVLLELSPEEMVSVLQAYVLRVLMIANVDKPNIGESGLAKPFYYLMNESFKEVLPWNNESLEQYIILCLAVQKNRPDLNPWFLNYSPITELLKHLKKFKNKITIHESTKELLKSSVVIIDRKEWLMVLDLIDDDTLFRMPLSEPTYPFDMHIDQFIENLIEGKQKAWSELFKYSEIISYKSKLPKKSKIPGLIVEIGKEDYRKIIFEWIDLIVKMDVIPRYVSVLSETGISILKALIWSMDIFIDDDVIEKLGKLVLCIEERTNERYNIAKDDWDERNYDSREIAGYITVGPFLPEYIVLEVINIIALSKSEVAVKMLKEIMDKFDDNDIINFKPEKVSELCRKLLKNLED